MRYNEREKTDRLILMKEVMQMDALNWNAAIFGVASLFIMGAYYPIVIKGEYYFSAKIWPVFLVIGLAAIAVSTQMNGLGCWLTAFFGATNLWAIVEIREQAERVKQGKYPKNPKRTY